MRRRGAAWLGVLVALAVFTAGCGGDKSPADAPGRGKPATANPNEPIQAMLRERAKRLLAGDVNGYLAPLGPEALAFEGPIARIAATLPLNRIDMTIHEANISSDGAKFRGASVWLTYNYRELAADNPFRVRFLYDMDRQQDGSWIITMSKFDRRSGVPPPPALWPTGPVEITRSPHFLVMARPGVPRVAEATALAEKGRAQLVPKLPLETDERSLLVLAKDTKEFVDNYGPEDATALQRDFCSLVPGNDQRLCRPEERLVMANLTDTLATGVVKLENAENTGTPQEVFQHELSHLALSRFTRPCTNRWVVEGTATVLADERWTDEWKFRVSPKGKLDQLPLNSNPLSYGFANAAVLYLVETFGAARFFDFYQNFKDLPVDVKGCSGQVTDVRSQLDERLLRRYYRFGVEDLEGFARGYIRKAVGAP